MISTLYLRISRSLKLLTANCTVALLTKIIAVEYQNMLGISNPTQFGWSLFTMYALVKPANIITMLPIATHNVNLCG
jgi:hypothetical protein